MGAAYQAGKVFWGGFAAIIILQLVGGSLVIAFANTHMWMSGGVKFDIGTTEYKYTYLQFSPSRVSYEQEVTVSGTTTKTTVHDTYYSDTIAHSNVLLLSMLIQQVVFNIGGGMALWVAVMYAFGAKFGRFGSHIFAKASAMSMFASMIVGGALYFFIGFNYYNGQVLNYDRSAVGARQGVTVGLVAGRINQYACQGTTGGYSIESSTTTFEGLSPVKCTSNSMTLGYSMILVIVGVGLMGLASILSVVLHIASCIGEGGNEIGDLIAEGKSAASGLGSAVRSDASAASDAAGSMSLSVHISASVGSDAGSGSASS